MASASTSNPENQVEVNWEEPRKHMQDEENYKLILTRKEDIISVIQGRLEEFGADAEAAMGRSVFKHYMRYPTIISKSGKCIHHLVSRETIGTPDPDPTAIFFRVNGEVVKFGQMEFALVTGLRFGPTDFDPFARHEIPENSLYTRCFQNNPISPNNLWYWYMVGENWEGLDAEDCVKLSQILIVAHIIMRMDAASSKIPDWVWVLVEDKKGWAKFPWGSISYQLLVNSIRPVKRHIPANSYHLTGNTLAFLGWIYEAFPDLGKSFGARVRRNCLPRGLRYTYKRGLTYLDIEITHILSRLEPDDKEVQHSYVTSVEAEGTPFSLIYTSQLERASTARRRVAGRALPQIPPTRRADMPPESSVASERRGQCAGTGVAEEDEAVYTLTLSRERKLVAEIASKAAKKARQELEGSNVFAEKVADLVVRKMTAILFPDRDQNINNDVCRATRMSTRSQDENEGEGEDNIEEEEDHHEVGENQFHEDDEVIWEENEGHAQDGTYVADEVEGDEKVEGDGHGTNEADEGVGQQETEGDAEDGEGEKKAEGDGETAGLDAGQTIEETASTSQMEKELAEKRSFQKEVFNEELLNDELPCSTPLAIVNRAEQTSQELVRTLQLQLEEEARQRKGKGPVVTYSRAGAGRKRKPASSLRSPFLPNDVRGTDFQRFLRGTGGEERNVGLPYPVGKEYFLDIKKIGYQLENEHVDPYLSILATDPSLAGIHKVKKGIRITGSTFYQAILEVWTDIEKDRTGSVRFDEDEEVKEADLKRLSKFVDGRLPKWGALESWEDANKVIMVCCFNKHWATCILDLTQCTLEIWDSSQHKFEAHHLQIRSVAFEPVARIVPQVLKYMNFYEKRLEEVIPIYSQWEHRVPKVNKIKQADSASCGPLAFLYAENRLKGVADKKMTMDDIQNYRNHIAESIFKFSMDGSTVFPVV